MATQSGSAQTKAKQAPTHLHKLDGKHHKTNGAGKSHQAQTHAHAQDDVEDAVLAQDLGHAPKAAHTQAESPRPASLADRSKDLIAGEAGSVATAAVIVVGAALIEVSLIPGIIIGAGAILLSKLFPQMGGYVRPAIKGAVRAGFSVAQKAREVVAEATEQVHDLVAEVKHENEHEHERTASEKQGHKAKKPVVAGNESPVH